MLKETKEPESIDELIEHLKQGMAESNKKYLKEPEQTKAWGYRVQHNLYKEILGYVTNISTKEE